MGVSGGIMNNTLPPESQSMRPDQQRFMEQDLCDPDRKIIYALGVVMLIFGTAITGHHQASIVGLALIVLCNLI